MGLEKYHKEVTRKEAKTADITAEEYSKEKKYLEENIRDL